MDDLGTNTTDLGVVPGRFCDWLNTYDPFRGNPTYFGPFECGEGQSEENYDCDAPSAKVWSLVDVEGDGNARVVEIGEMGANRWLPIVAEVPVAWCDQVEVTEPTSSTDSPTTSSMGTPEPTTDSKGNDAFRTVSMSWNYLAVTAAVVFRFLR